MNTLSFGDMEDFENETGEPLMKAVAQMQKGEASTKSLIALVWICGRTENPDFTLDDVRKMKLGELEFDVVADADPTSDGDEKN